MRNAAFRAALIVGSSLLVYLASRTSWALAFASAGALMLVVAVVNSRVLPNPAESRGVPAARSAAFLAAYRTFFTQPGAAHVLAFILFYRLGDIMMFAMAKPLLRDIGIDTAARGVLNGVGILTSMSGSLAGGAIIARRGIERCLVPMTYLQNGTAPVGLFSDGTPTCPPTRPSPPGPGTWAGGCGSSLESASPPSVREGARWSTRAPARAAETRTRAPGAQRRARSPPT